MKREMIDMSDPRVAQIGHPAPPWLMNYADLMTELVCFFVIMYAMTAALNKDVQKAKKDVEEKMKDEKVQGDVKVTKEGMQITIQEQGENVFFESGSAELSPRMKEILAKLTPALKTLVKDHHDVIVEGHTDDVPINSAQFSSNWELSTARATSVVQYMINDLDFPAASMGATGYGQFHPLVPNTSEENRSKNRRVVFFVKNPQQQFKPGTKEGKEGEATEKDKPVADTAATTTDQTTTGPPADTATAAPADDQSNPIPDKQETVVSP